MRQVEIKRSISAILLIVISLLGNAMAIGGEENSCALELSDIGKFKLYVSLGDAHLNQGEYDKAISNYSKAMELNHTDAGAFINRGIAYDATGQNDLAIVDFNKAIELNPKSAEAYSHRGRAYGPKDRDLAIKDFNKALDIDPRNANSYIYRAMAYYYKEDYNKAWEDVHKGQGLGAQVPPGFLMALRKDSGREK